MNACQPDVALLHLAQRVVVPPLPLAEAVIGEAATVVATGARTTTPRARPRRHAAAPATDNAGTTPRSSAAL
jgi:hypothetical protein